ncbi:MAG: hypothetical protein JO000_04315 [Alphaproteobacteria bacterium]|nr:hypothetical protein [Alphaproteobacteria bacterium]
MNLDDALAWLQATGPARTISENEVLFPWIESIHVLAITLVVGTIVIVDLRLIGIASLDRAASRLMRDVLPFTWGAFVVAAITGSLLFASNARDYAHNFFFEGKLVLLALAGFNMAMFHIVGARDIARWGATRQTPLTAKAAGTASLLIWIAVVAFGRWIGFTLH